MSIFLSAELKLVLVEGLGLRLGYTAQRDVIGIDGKVRGIKSIGSTKLVVSQG